MLYYRQQGDSEGSGKQEVIFQDLTLDPLDPIYEVSIL
jgi:hypothetical protein